MCFGLAYLYWLEPMWLVLGCPNNTWRRIRVECLEATTLLQCFKKNLWCLEGGMEARMCLDYIFKMGIEVIIIIKKVKNIAMKT